MRDGLRSAVAAVTFLTAVPIGRRTEIGARELRSGMVFFPLVGAVVGAVIAGVAWATAIALPGLPAAVLGVAAGVAVTGAMHLDGLADTADGVGAALSGGDPSTAMHDPRFGVFGGAAIVLDLLLKVSVASALVAGPRFPLEAIAAGALARAAAILALGTTPYAGGASGTGAWTRGVGLGRCLVGSRSHPRSARSLSDRRSARWFAAAGRARAHQALVAPPSERHDRRHPGGHHRALRDRGIGAPRSPPS